MCPDLQGGRNVVQRERRRRLGQRGRRPLPVTSAVPPSAATSRGLGGCLSTAHMIPLKRPHTRSAVRCRVQGRMPHGACTAALHVLSMRGGLPVSYSRPCSTVGIAHSIPGAPSRPVQPLCCSGVRQLPRSTGVAHFAARTMGDTGLRHQQRYVACSFGSVARFLVTGDRLAPATPARTAYATDLCARTHSACNAVCATQQA